MLWLGCGPAAVASIGPLAWEPPYATGAALKSKKKKVSDLAEVPAEDSKYLNLLISLLSISQTSLACSDPRSLDNSKFSLWSGTHSTQTHNPPLESSTPHHLSCPFFPKEFRPCTSYPYNLPGLVSLTSNQHLPFNEHFLCTRVCAKCFKRNITLTPGNKALLSFYR